MAPSKRMTEGNPFWRLVVWVVIFEAMERLTYYTISNNSTHYIRSFMGMGTASTSQLKSAFAFIGYGSSLFWGIIADTLLGRKRTLLTIGSAYAVFVILLAISTMPSMTHHVVIQDGEEAIMSGKVLFFLSFFGIALCMGGIKANVASIGADQFDESIPSHCYWRRVFFTWFYVMVQAGSIIGGFLSGPMQQQDPSTSGYSIGFGIAGGAMVIAVIILLAVYRKLYSPELKPLGIGRTLSALFDAVGQKIACVSVSPDAFDFGANEASRIHQRSLETGNKDSNDDCLENLIKDEANWMMKRVGPKYGAKSAADAFQLSRTVALWITMLATALVYDVSGNVVVLQGQQMLAPSTFYNSTFQQSIFDPIICLIYMMLILYVGQPVFKKLGWELTAQRRIVLSTASAAIGCLIGAVLEIARKNAPLVYDAAGEQVFNSDGLPVHDISLLWQLLIFNFTSLMQALCWPAGVEFFYTQMPEDFKSIGQGIFQFCLGAASAVDILVEAIGHSLNWLPNNLDTGYLENFYFTVMTLGFLAFFYGMYALYLYKKSGGDYGLKCGIDVDAIEARMHEADKVEDEGKPVKM